MSNGMSIERSVTLCVKLIFKMLLFFTVVLSISAEENADIILKSIHVYKMETSTMEKKNPSMDPNTTRQNFLARDSGLAGIC